MIILLTVTKHDIEIHKVEREININLVYILLLHVYTLSYLYKTIYTFQAIKLCMILYQN